MQILAVVAAVVGAEAKPMTYNVCHTVFLAIYLSICTGTGFGPMMMMMMMVVVDVLNSEGAW